MAITERDLEKVAIETIDIGQYVVSKTTAGQPHVWQVDAKKTEWNERDGQTITLKPQPEPGETHVSGINAPFGTLMHRVRQR
ncbi:hypothetical protein NJB1604_25140 [Mycobacterium marinum]|uniref:hypothetical protein n=1 Tax=Mycobacterium marinum TaxID=1781 RepID=UPI0021C27D22|nr:hypothetical protein [Mycobacterium marinum]GJO45769.1 hypothetical protein NJB1604_25140 [Mycobacterium marinum]